MPALPQHIAELRSPRVIRERCANVLEAALRGESRWFAVDLSRLSEAARRTAEVTRERYPSLQVPPHSRFAHFDASGVQRTQLLHDMLAALDSRERARRLVELVVVSVLVDAGAGPDWRYTDIQGEPLGRSEGLAVASLRWLQEGALAVDAAPFRVDAERLLEVSDAQLAQAFQVSDDNPLVGLSGRAALLRELGRAVRARTDVFGAEERVGGLLDTLEAGSQHGQLPAAEILAVLLDALADIWPGRLRLDGFPLGDVWPHPAAGGSGPSAGLVPFHKLSQWLSFSLIHPLEVAGLRVVERDELTGLAEYRNGGLFIDTGVLAVQPRSALEQAHEATSELVVEWRALTVALLQRLLDPVRERLGLDASRMTLPSMLEGGTWAAGRRLARELRADGSPPLRIRSDGTVF